MKEKTSDIDILEEKEKKAIELLKQEPDFSLRYYERENAIDIVLKLIETLIAENKELKKEKDRVGKLYYEANENCIKYEKDYIPKSKVRELAKKYEFALNGYDSSIADYKHSQNIGKYMGYIELLENDNHIPHID